MLIYWIRLWWKSGFYLVFPFFRKLGKIRFSLFFQKNRAKYLAYASLLTDFLPSAVKNWTHKHKRSVCQPFYCTMSTFITRKLALCFCRTVSTRDCFSVTDCAVDKVVLWSRGGAHLTKPGWSKPHTHSNPTNLALFGHKIALYRFNQGAHTIAGGSNGSRGLSSRTPSL